MGLVNTVEAGTHALGQLVSRQHAGGFDNGALAMQPLGLDGIEPRALAGQVAGQDTHAAALAFDLPVVGPNPVAHELADMPRGVIPDQHPDFDALARQRLATPFQKIQRDRTDRPTVHEAQQHAVWGRWTARALDQHPVAGQSLGIVIVFGPFQFLQAQRLAGFGPTVQPRLGYPAPPDFVCETHCPGRICPRQAHQPVARVFF